MFGEDSAPQIEPLESTQMVSNVKLPFLKKGKYTLWSMRMEHYLTNTNYGLGQLIMNDDEPIQTIRDENGVESKLSPKTAQAILARQRERKAKSILLLAIPDEYQLRFHTIKDSKSLRAAIKSRFGGNVESKKMQKIVLKQQFENFFVPDIEGLDKAYDRNKEGIDESDINDLYNNLKVFEADIKGHSSFRQPSSSLYTDDLMFSLFSNQSNSLQLNDEDLEQIDHDDLDEMDLKWQVAMLSMRVKRYYKKTGRKLNFNSKEPIGSDKAKENVLIDQDGLGYDWSYIAQEEPTEFALMAYTLGTNTKKNEAAYEEKIAVLEFEVNYKGDQVKSSAMMKGFDIGIQEKKAKLFNEWERQIAQLGMNMGQDRQMQIVRGNGENQFRQYGGQNVGNLNGFNAVQNVRNQKEEAAIQLQAKEFDLMAAAADLDKIKEVNANCILMANLQQSSSPAKFVGDFKSLAKEAHESLAKHKALELEIEHLLRAVFNQDIMPVMQKTSVVDTSNLQTELESYKDMQQKIKRLQAQLGDHKGKRQKRGTSANIKFAKQSIMENLPKVGETYALSKPVTSNSVATPQKSKVVKNDKVIALGMFRINPFKTFREEKHVPNIVRASARIKPITVSQSSVITKKDVNSDVNGLSST
nr:ribonuclease H-like domain-containing protein [Tanacetum cinerariifolium]